MSRTYRLRHLPPIHATEDVLERRVHWISSSTARKSGKFAEKFVEGGPMFWPDKTLSVCNFLCHPQIKKGWTNTPRTKKRLRKTGYRKIRTQERDFLKDSRKWSDGEDVNIVEFKVVNNTRDLDWY